MTWITPFDWLTAAMVTFAVLPEESITHTAPSLSEKASVSPSTVLYSALPFIFLMSASMSAAECLPGRT